MAATATTSAPQEVAQMDGPLTAGELLGFDAGGEEVEIITTIPTRVKTGAAVRTELVAWCLQHGLPVPPAELAARGRCR